MALSELGRIDRILFILSWLQSVDLRRRVHAGPQQRRSPQRPSPGPASSAASARIQDRSFEQQRYRASGLTLVTAAIALWIIVYTERAVHALETKDQPVDPALLKYLSPLDWEHIKPHRRLPVEGQGARTGQVQVASLPQSVLAEAEIGTLGDKWKRVVAGRGGSRGRGRRRPEESGAALLGLSARHTRRLVRAYRDGGDRALIYKARGKNFNKQLIVAVREYVVELVKTRYADFGPTLASEVLLDKDGMN